MNSLLLLRKSVSSKRVTLASLTQQALLILNHNNEQFIAGNIHNISTSTRKMHNYTGGFASSKVQIESFLRKDFHAGVGGSLNFGASSGLSQAASYAIEDSSVKGTSNDERLQIAKLGIAGEIVSALAKKGITKLFPIQKAGL